MRIRDCSYQVGCTRARCCDANAELATGRGVTFGRVTSTLFVTNQDVANYFGIHQWVIGGQNRATGQSKDGIDTE